MSSSDSESGTSSPRLGTRKTPFVPASAVAALLGENPWKSIDQALLTVTSYDPVGKEWLAALQAQDRRVMPAALQARTVQDVVEALPLAATEEPRQQAETTVRARAQASAHAAEQARTQDPQARAAPAIVKAWEAQAVAATRTTVGQHREADVLQQAVTQARAQAAAQGTAPRLTEKLEAAPSKLWTWRDPQQTFVLGGRVDGWQPDTRTVVEIKTRRRAWTQVPAYDRRQLEVYLKLTEAREGLLVEHLPGGRLRETVVEPLSPRTWNATVTTPLRHVLTGWRMWTEADVAEAWESQWRTTV